MQPKVSIVIPVYNGANYMREAIDSALNQTYENCEVIVVNDGSTDETEQIALSYGDKIRYFAKENGGVSTALNLGIEKMEGEYFCYLPHDDLFLPEKVRIQIDAIQKCGDMTKIVWSKTNLFLMEDQKYIEEGTNYYYNDNTHLTNGNFPVYLGLVRTISVMLHRSCFERQGLFDERLFTSQDYDMWYRTFRNQKTVYIDKPLVSYRLHAQQGTNTDREYYNNCVELAKSKFLDISEDEIKSLFGNRYRFTYFMLVYYKEEAHWKECWELASKHFCRLEEPEDVERECKELYRYLLGEDGQEKGVVLWCAGKNAMRFLVELRERRIPVDVLCDGDVRKQGKKINGYQCVAPWEIDKKNSRIIVTKDNPEELMTQLKSEGYEHVTSFEEIGSKVHYTLPYKDEVIATRIYENV